MVLKRFYHEGLAHASYLVGCPRAGEAVVIDANRDTDQYIRAARAEGLRIVAVTETHIHADYVSGSRELAEKTGARLYLSNEGDAVWKYAFADQPNVTLVRDGDSFQVGGVRFDVMATPGHTPEHISLVMTDTSVGDEPLGIFTGDHVFVGDVGRPDLLERAANFEGTMEKGARVLHTSLKKMSELPDHVLVWPAHGAGSACGKSLGGVPVSTIGYEKRFNWGLNVPLEDEFVNEVLEGQPEPPYYFKEMKRINRDGPDLLGTRSSLQKGDGADIESALDSAFVLDLRGTDGALANPLTGAINVPLGRSFLTWAGWLAPYDKDIWLVAASAEEAEDARRELALIGLDRVAGWVSTAEVAASGLLDPEPIRQVSMSEATRLAESGQATFLDVRGSTERADTHVPGTVHIPLGYLAARKDELDATKPIAVHCAAGGRSPIAVSLLRSLGFTHVMNAPGGIAEHLAA